jgi:RimJ/RimL family protein N-acetyltransferase
MSGFIRQVIWSIDREWAETAFPFVPSVDCGGFVAIDEHGERVGIAVLGRVTNSSAHLEGALTYKAVKAGLVEFVKDYVFEDLCLSYLFCTVAANNIRSLRFVRRIGGREFHRIPNGFDDGIDLVQFEIRKEDVNLLSKKYRCLQ